MLPRPTDSSYAHCQNDDQASNRTRGDKSHPLRFAVETLRFAPPRGVPLVRSYRWGRCTTPDTRIGIHRGEE